MVPQAFVNPMAVFEDESMHTYYILKAKLPEYEIMVGMRQHLFHFSRGESRPVAVNKICHNYGVTRSPEKTELLLLKWINRQRDEHKH